MVIGHSAGVAAALALADGVDVQDVNIDTLQARLREQGQILTMAEQIPAPGAPPPPPPHGLLPPVVAGSCVGSNARATLNKTAAQGTELLLLGPKGLCASVLGYSVSNGAKVVGANCHPDDRSPPHQNQVWAVDEQLICLRMQNAAASGGGPKCSRSCLAPSPHNAFDTYSLWLTDIDIQH